jgi:capsular exopolysaccharide synthesis family protein
VVAAQPAPAPDNGFGVIKDVVIPEPPKRLADRAAIAQPAFVISRSLVTIANPQGGPAEAIRVLRTYLMAHHVGEGRRALAVCGASPSVGCTFTAANLAVALSQIGVKTLLIDANMQTPGVDQLIQPPGPREGLKTCLGSSDYDFDHAIDADILPNLSVMFSGGVAANRQELLAGSRFKDLMEFCLRDYGATIVDTPAANTCSDARRVGMVVGYSLLVARVNKSYVDDLKTLAAQLRDDHVRVVGTVLNEA